MKTLVRRLGILAGLALAAGMAAELWGRTAFRLMVQSDVKTLLAGSSAGEARLVTVAMLDGLPEPVQRYLRYTGVIGKPFVRTVHLKQRGQMLLASGRPWIPLKAQRGTPCGHRSLSGTPRCTSAPSRSCGRATRTEPEGGMLIRAASLVRWPTRRAGGSTRVRGCAI
jgi:hypothetical protein